MPCLDPGASPSCDCLHPSLRSTPGSAPHGGRTPPPPAPLMVVLTSLFPQPHTRRFQKVFSSDSGWGWDLCPMHVTEPAPDLIPGAIDPVTAGLVAEAATPDLIPGDAAPAMTPAANNATQVRQSRSIRDTRFDAGLVSDKGAVPLLQLQAGSDYDDLRALHRTESEAHGLRRGWRGLTMIGACGADGRVRWLPFAELRHLREKAVDSEDAREGASPVLRRGPRALGAVYRQG